MIELLGLRSRLGHIVAPRWDRVTSFALGTGSREPHVGEAMKDFLLALTSLITGGLAFWIPENILLRRVTSGSAWLPASFVGPIVLLSVYLLIVRYRRSKGVGPSSALFAIVGVWSTAPWLMLLGASLQTPKIFQSMRFVDYAYLCLMSVCPPLTLWTSAMDGTAYGLIFATIMMPVCHLLLEKERWLIPPGARRRIHFNRGFLKNNEF